MTIADYEGDVDSTNIVDDATPNTLSNDEPYTGGQRTIETSGGSVTPENANPAGFDLPSAKSNTPQGSNGVRWATVSTSGSSGSVTIQREMNLPSSDAFAFLIKPASQAFNLTLTFTEMAGGSEVSHEFQIPVNPGTGWLKLGIPFGEISQDFSPVNTRSGGNGKLVSITMTADRPVSFGVDQMLFGTISEGEFFGRAEFHDFERSTNAYGPPFCGGVYGFSDNVAPGSDGYSARTVTENASCFGYNYGGGLGPPALAFVDVDANDVLSFYGKGIGEETSVSPYIETSDGAGGFGGGVSKTLPADTWQKFEIPLDDLGSDPSALLDLGFRNVGFGGCSNCAIDDVKIVPKE
jgi:hypothetical protein